MRNQALEDPEGLLAELGEGGAFIDEVQRAPDLLLAIKAVVDKDQRNGQYLLSGSHQPRVSQAVSDSLLGRATYRTLRPLTLSELRFDEHHPGWSFLFDAEDARVLEELDRRAKANGELDWQEVVQTGGFPRAIAAQGQAQRILNNYVEVYSTTDVRDVLTVESPTRLDSFVRLVATRTAQELNASSIGSDLGLSVSTVRRWLDVLRRSYLIELVPPFSRNAGARIIKAPKIYAVDAALALAAARDTTPTGFHLETLVATDLFVWRDNKSTRSLFHWRLASGQEVDFVLEEAGQLLPVEVKASRSVGTSDARHLKTFRERYAKSPRGVLLSCDPDIRTMPNGVVACPWWAVV